MLKKYAVIHETTRYIVAVQGAESVCVNIFDSIAKAKRFMLSEISRLEELETGNMHRILIINTKKPSILVKSTVIERSPVVHLPVITIDE